MSQPAESECALLWSNDYSWSALRKLKFRFPWDLLHNVPEFEKIAISQHKRVFLREVQIILDE